MGGGDGGGTTTTTSSASFPPEFRPLAEAAVKQIMGLQGALPLAPFGAPQVAPVPGMAPFSQAGMELVPSLLLSTPAEQALGALGIPANMLAQQAARLGQLSPASQSSLGLLEAQLGGPARFGPQPALNLPGPPPGLGGESVFAGFNPEQVAAWRAALPGGQIPMFNGAPFGMVTPPPNAQAQIDQLTQQLAAIQAQGAGGAGAVGGSGAAPGGMTFADYLSALNSAMPVP